MEILSYIFGGGKGRSQNSWPGVGRGLKLVCFGFKILYIAPWICFRTLYVYRILYVFAQKNKQWLKRKREENRYFCFHRIWTAKHLLIFFCKEKLMFCGQHMAMVIQNNWFLHMALPQFLLRDLGQSLYWSSVQESDRFVFVSH